MNEATPVNEAPIVGENHDALAARGVVEFRGVSHRFGAFEALRGLSLEVRRGDIYGLLGLNGAGKTTALRILLGLLRRDAGEVRVFGIGAESGRIEASGRIGAMIESPAFYPHLSGIRNLELLHALAGGPEGRGPRQVLELTGLADSARVRAGRYSMGMLQRLYLAQALLGRPELLVLDEPTSNLDPKGIMEVRGLIQRLNAEEGLTVLLSSHQLSEVEGLCNRVGIINRGRMILESGVADLFLAELCELDIELDRAAEAIPIAAGVEGARDARLGEEGRLRVRLPRARRAELNRRLIEAGHWVSELRERRQTLEDFFHERIAGDAA